MPVLVNEQRKKLSKRRDKVALEQYRDEGYLADAMVNYLMTLGWAPAGDTEIVPWSRIEAEFRLEDVNHVAGVLRPQEAGRVQRRVHPDAAASTSSSRRATPWLPAGSGTERCSPAMAEHVQTRVVTLADVAPMVDFLFLTEPEIDEGAWNKAMAPPSSRRRCCATWSTRTRSVDSWHAELKSALEAIGERYELKLGKAQAPVRVAVTGRTVGPPLFESLEVLGRDETLRRLRAALARLDAVTMMRSGHAGRRLAAPTAPRRSHR